MLVMQLKVSLWSSFQNQVYLCHPRIWSSLSFVSLHLTIFAKQRQPLAWSSRIQSHSLFLGLYLAIFNCNHRLNCLLSKHVCKRRLYHACNRCHFCVWWDSRPLIAKKPYDRSITSHFDHLSQSIHELSFIRPPNWLHPVAQSFPQTKLQNLRNFSLSFATTIPSSG